MAIELIKSLLEERGALTSSAFYDLMPHAYMGYRGSGTYDKNSNGGIDITTLTSNKILVVSPPILEYRVCHFQVNFYGLNSGGTINLYASNDGDKTDTVFATRTTTAGAMNASFNLINFGAKHLVVEITGITTGYISTMTLVGKR